MLRISTMPPDLWAWVTTQLGPATAIVQTRRGEEADLWRLHGERDDAWLKRHRHAAKATREHAAYARLRPALGDAMPRVLAFEPALGALVLSACPGTPADDVVDPSSVLAMHRAAGAVLARMHALPIDDDDPLPLPDAYARRFAHWHARAEAPMRAAGAHAAWRAARDRFDARVFTAVTRRFCHRDVRPANWIWDPPALHVLDFGQSRRDDPMADLVSVARDASAFAAFLEGYGASLSAAQIDRLAMIAIVHALAGVVRGDPAARRDALHRLVGA